MPDRAARPCKRPGCRGITRDASGFCAGCSSYAAARWEETQAQRNAAPRASAHDRGYDGTWQKMRARVLAEHPYCERCLRLGIVTAANTVHHIIPIETDPTLRLQADNLEALCADCHEIVEGRRVAEG